MYKSFFGLRENPFNGNPDPRYLHFTPQMQKALEQLTYGVQHCKGLILLTGEVGTGKTTLINHLLNWLRVRNTPTAFVFNSHLTADHLLDFILADFGVPIDFRLNGSLLLHLKLWLTEQFHAGKKPVLIVDEAQGLSIEALEEIRLLLNLETHAEKLLQIVLAGQPELEDKLKRPDLAQLRQRIELRCGTAPLRLTESHSYIAERLRIAGANGNPIFPAETMDLAHFYSKGIPRVLNLLCEHALINAFAEESRQVPAWAVEEAACDFLLTDWRLVGAGRRRNEGTNDGPPPMQPIFGTELARTHTAVTAILHDQACEKSSSAPATSAIRQSVSVAGANRRGSGPALIAAHMFMPEILRHVYAATRRNSQLVHLAKIARHWALEFVRDWNGMMNAIDFSTIAKSLFAWLRHTATSKSMTSSRKPVV
jgi:general secretion pathway protein A